MRRYFKEADLDNFERTGQSWRVCYTLNDERIFYLLMVKCNVIAEILNVKKDSFVVYNPASGVNNSNNVVA